MPRQCILDRIVWEKLPGYTIGWCAINFPGGKQFHRYRSSAGSRSLDTFFGHGQIRSMGRRRRGAACRLDVGPQWLYTRRTCEQSSTYSGLQTSWRYIRTGCWTTMVGRKKLFKKEKKYQYEEKNADCVSG